MRIYDKDKVQLALNCISENIGDVSATEWLDNPDNIALENEHGDIALFEYGLIKHKIYSGHYYFKSRGRQAIQSARELLDELFNSCYNISILIGLTPRENKAAAWISRRIGFTSYGIETIHDKEYELFILTKKEFNNG